MATFTITDNRGAYAIVSQYLKGVSDLTLNANSPASNELCAYFEVDGARVGCLPFYPSNLALNIGVIDLTAGAHVVKLKTYSSYATLPGVTPTTYVPTGTLISTYTVNITVANYTKPSITAYSAQRCDSSGVVKGSGTYIKYSLTAAIDPVNIGGTNKNTTAIKILYRVQGTTPYSEKVLTSTVFSWNVSNTRITDVVLPASNTYEVVASVVDRWGSALSGAVLPRDVLPFSAKMISNLLSVAIGTLADEAGKLKVALASKFTQAVEFLGTITAAAIISTKLTVNGPITVSGSFDLGGTLRMKPTGRRFSIMENDFTSVTSAPYLASAPGSGSVSEGNGAADRPGIVILSSGTANPSGYAYCTSENAFNLSGGETHEVVFRVINTANLTVRIGFCDAFRSSSATVSDGVYINISGTSLTGKTSKDGTATTSSAYTIGTTDYYRARIEYKSVNSVMTAVFTLMDMSGTVLWTQSITTNIPNGLIDYVGAGIIALRAATSATQLVALDYMCTSIDRDLVR